MIYKKSWKRVPQPILPLEEMNDSNPYVLITADQENRAVDKTY